MADSLLEIRSLGVRFHTRKGTVYAVDGVNLGISAGRVLGIVGESGCGKSVTSMSILQLLERTARIADESEIVLDGDDISKYRGKKLRNIRGKDIAMIFQDPMTSLNPVMTIGKQLAEAARTHEKITKSEANARALSMLKRAGIPSPETRMREYPHQLSGGMKQRVMIAMALICRPRVLIADEPTTALDVTIQAQILALIRELKEETGTAVILITHDMGVVAQQADEIAVMYAGQVVEYGDVRSIFRHPHHPYTEGLLRSIPVLNHNVDRLFSIEGAVPSQYTVPEGCRFAPRCPCARPECLKRRPEMQEFRGSSVRCFYPIKDAPDKTGSEEGTKLYVTGYATGAAASE